MRTASSAKVPCGGRSEAQRRGARRRCSYRSRGRVAAPAAPPPAAHHAPPENSCTTEHTAALSPTVSPDEGVPRTYCGYGRPRLSTQAYVQSMDAMIAWAAMFGM